MPDTLMTVLFYAVPTLVAAIFLYACALVHAAWRLWSSADERAWWQFLREGRRARRRQDWATTRQVWRTDLWHRGDGAAVLGLLALAAVVIAVCR